MSSTRADLERLDREELIARADGAGVAKARILTRPELVDELLLRSSIDDAAKERTRGMFGRARDLLARLVERGLNKPQAAERIRAVGRPTGRPSAPAALPTLTLAEIYVAQGYRERALETLERVLAAEPEHAAARALHARLEDASFPVPVPKLPPEPEQDDVGEPAPSPPSPVATVSGPTSSPVLGVPVPAPEPSHMLDDSPLPPRYEVDECVGVAVDPRTIYVYWEIRSRTLAELRLPSDLPIAVQIVVVEAGWNGPNTWVRDYESLSILGELFVHDLPPGSVIRAAVGLRRGSEIIPIAHSAALETPPVGPLPLAGTKLVRWTPSGAVPVDAGDADGVASALTGTITRLRKDAASVWRRAQPIRVPSPARAESALGTVGAASEASELALLGSSGRLAREDLPRA